MDIGLCFYVLMLVWAVFFCLWNFGGTAVGVYGPFGNTLLIFILFLLLGWRVFGAPLHG